MALDWIGFSYAVLVSVGEVIGFLKADSVPSLAAGLLFGLLAAVGAYLTSQNPKECVAVAGHLWNSHCGDGPEIHQLREVHASGFNDFIQELEPPTLLVEVNTSARLTCLAVWKPSSVQPPAEEPATASSTSEELARELSKTKRVRIATEVVVLEDESKPRKKKKKDVGK